MKKAYCVSVRSALGDADNRRSMVQEDDSFNNTFGRKKKERKFEYQESDASGLLMEDDKNDFIIRTDAFGSVKIFHLLFNIFHRSHKNRAITCFYCFYNVIIIYIYI